MAGQPKKFTEEKIFEYWFEFCTSIFEDGNKSTPTFTSFVLWLKKEKHIKVSTRTLYNTLAIYFPHIKKDVENIRADTLMNGALTGKFVSTPTIFALKNWCGWKDKNEDIDIEVENIAEVDREVFGDD